MSRTPTTDDNEDAGALLKKLERQSGGMARIIQDIDTEAQASIDIETRYVEHIRPGHISSVLFVCVMFVLAVVALLFLSPTVLLINNKEQLTNDLNDGLYAYYTYSNKVLGNQIGGTCHDLTIRCKFSTMSPMLKERFEQYGFVLGATQSANKRYNVSALAYPAAKGAAVDATTLDVSRRSNQAFDSMVNRVYSSRTGIYQDRQFFDRLLNRFGLRQDNTLSGSTVKEFDDKFNERVNNGDERYSPPANVENAPSQSSEAQDTIDENGRGIYSLKSLNEMSGVWADKIYTNIESKANTHLSLACAYATYGSVAENAAIRAKLISTARFAMNYLALADDLKAGTPMDGEIAVESLANKLTKANAQQKNAMDADGYRVPALGESVKNPLVGLGLSAATVRALLALGAPSVPGTEYLKGALTTGLVQTSATDRSASGLCAEGMSARQMAFEQQSLCWTAATMPLAAYIGFATDAAMGAAKELIEKILCPVSTKLVVELFKLPARADISVTLAARMAIATAIEAQQYDAATTGMAAQNIIFAGTGALLGDRAQSLGMRPASTASLTEYYAASEVLSQKIEQERRIAARGVPWDAANPYSFMGSIVAKLVPAGSRLPTSSWRASTATLLAALPAALSSSLQSGAHALYTQPSHFQISRILQPAATCGMQIGLDFEINPDFACNVRYSMSTAELALSIDDILNYMTNSHPENAQRSLAQVTARDTEADPARGERMKQQARDGAAAAYVDPVTGKPNKYTEYAKFMQYCVNRQDPWGGVGMAVDEPDPVYPEDPLDLKGRRTSDNSSGLREEPDPTLPTDSYYGLAWGGASDQDWYTGKKCTDDDDPMMKYFRGYTMACAVLASMSGSRQCWDQDTIPNSQTELDFYTTNNIVFKAAT